MNREAKEYLEYSYLIEKGILFNYQEFRSEKKEVIEYNFSCPEYETLLWKYNLRKIAGKGDEFTRAKRLLNHLTPRMTHNSGYDNHIACNSLDLLEFCYEKKENGINCLNKSKIFSECCLALGIPSRRVIIMPYSPYDCDNHVVAEIFDIKMKKWIMMDPTTGGMFIDENRTPLSMLEIREYFANNKFITFIGGNERNKDLNKVKEKHLKNNWYICKNSFRFSVQKHQEFGQRKDDMLTFIPCNYSAKNYEVTNGKFRVSEYGSIYPQLLEHFQENYELAKSKQEPVATDIEALSDTND